MFFHLLHHLKLCSWQAATLIIMNLGIHLMIRLSNPDLNKEVLNHPPYFSLKMFLRLDCSIYTVSLNNASFLKWELTNKLSSSALLLLLSLKFHTRDGQIKIKSVLHPHTGNNISSFITHTLGVTS